MAVVTRHVGDVRRDAPSGGVYVIRDYLMRIDGSPEPRAGDDAMDAGWFSDVDVRALDTSAGLVDALLEWGILSG